MLTLKYGNWNKQGRWHWLYWVGRRPRKQVVITCPKCGAEIRLNGYRIFSTGEVDPELTHSCGFSDTIKLENYANYRD